MNAVEWWNDVKELEQAMRQSAPNDAALSRQKSILEKVGSILMQQSNPDLGNALLSNELDAGLMFRTLSKAILLQCQDPDERSCCREISDMKIKLDAYVVHFIGETGWILGKNSANMTWLYHVLEYPNVVAAYPNWFEDVVKIQPWAWQTAFTEQFFMGNLSPCREFLYDSNKAPWESLHAVEKMVGWLYYNEATTPKKAACATAAWPEWMAHVRNYTSLHYQMAQAPQPKWKSESAWAKRYFEDVAIQVLHHWQPNISESFDCKSLLLPEP